METGAWPPINGVTTPGAPSWGCSATPGSRQCSCASQLNIRSDTYSVKNVKQNKIRWRTVMAHLHWWRWIRIPKPDAYIVLCRTFHIAQTRTPTPTLYFCKGHESEFVPGNLNEPLLSKILKLWPKIWTIFNSVSPGGGGGGAGAPPPSAEESASSCGPHRLLFFLRCFFLSAALLTSPRPLPPYRRHCPCRRSSARTDLRSSVCNTCGLCLIPGTRTWKNKNAYHHCVAPV